mmetsp:Transcript_104999/g.146403  ORF Transcript_104999/g.146403 Transcript_104999/m.146403 type:complete len:144 (-) Transcript_104999:60-491(-)
MDDTHSAGSALEDVAGRLNDTDRFVILLNLCAAIFGSFIYYLLSLRQRQGIEQRGAYYTGPFVSLSEASHTWKVYRQFSNKSEQDMHVCNFCGFAIKASPGDMPIVGAAPRESILPEDAKAGANKDKEGLKQRKNIKKNKNRS